MITVARFFLAFSVLFFTPVGVYVCGSLTPALFLPETSPRFELLSDGTVVFHDTETAVTNYLSTPFVTLALTSLLALIYRCLFRATLLPMNQVEKRKPPTPPPCFDGFASITPYPS